jgi:HSP20 family protein
MNLTRWDPFRDLLTLQDRMNRMLNDPFARLTSPAEAVSGWMPPVDIHEEPDRIVLRAEMPGISRDDIELSVENGTLTLRGEKRHENEVGSDNAYRQERFYGSFARSFVLPAAIDPDHIKATYRDGVLEVVVPKAEEAKPKKIKVLSGGDAVETRTGERTVRAAS